VLILAYVSLASPPRRPPSPPLFPYTTLFRSDAAGVLRHDRLMGKRRETVMRETIDVESIGLHGDLSAGSPFRVEEICSQHQIDFAPPGVGCRRIAPGLPVLSRPIDTCACRQMERTEHVDAAATHLVKVDRSRERELPAPDRDFCW